jgi:DNA-binding LytR/AlgR family response regulator
MRTKVIIDGLKNSQKIRVILNEIVLFTTVKGMAYDTFGQTEQRVAVWDALMDIAMRRRHGLNMTGYSGEKRGYRVQVDLV